MLAKLRRKRNGDDLLGFGNNKKRTYKGMKAVRKVMDACQSKQFHITGPKFKRRKLSR